MWRRTRRGLQYTPERRSGPVVRPPTPYAVNRRSVYFDEVSTGNLIDNQGMDGYRAWEVAAVAVRRLLLVR